MNKMKLNIQLFASPCWSGLVKWADNGSNRVFGRVGYDKDTVSRSGDYITVRWGSSIQTNFSSYGFGMGGQGNWWANGSSIVNTSGGSGWYLGKGKNASFTKNAAYYTNPDTPDDSEHVKSKTTADEKVGFFPFSITVQATSGAAGTFTIKSGLWAHGNHSNRKNATVTVSYPAVLYTISYNLQGGSGDGSEQKVNYNTSFTAHAAPTKVGHSFYKWNTKSDGTGTNYDAGAIITPSSDMTLYAIWTVNNYYLDVNGWLSSDGGATYGPQISGGIAGYGTFDIKVGSNPKQTGLSDYYAQSPYNTSYTIDNIKALPGHTYVTVYSGSATGNVGYISSTTAGQTNVVLQFYAHKYTIQYNANGGSGAPSSQTKYYGTSIYLSNTRPTRSGYTFRNWNTNTSGTGTTCTPGQELTSDLSTGNAQGTTVVPLYAIWDMNPPTIWFTSYQVTSPFNINLAWASTGVNVSYVVSYKKSTASAWQTISCGSSTSLSLAVDEETTYDIKVTATNDGGSATTDTIHLTTPADQAKIRIYNSSTWLQGKTYIYNGSAWVKAKKVYIYDGSQWKINSNN